MSNDNMNLTNEPCEGTLAPGQWTESLTFQPASPSEKETWFRFGATFDGCLVVNGVNLGPAADLAALVRDARRFRRMEKAHGDTHHHDGWGTIQKLYCAHPIIRPLAEIADALPEVEQK